MQLCYYRIGKKEDADHYLALASDLIPEKRDEVHDYVKSRINERNE